ncbi:amino acid permease [Bifidobacterium actinocoloniiforme DSM 22766]|uniref:Amino acid permease n=1 Tax=Bifidobacterium actinocoloniiforme DSM 22766 TaxID=1437605 RepID=A0A086Z2I7_9BIFI|nr:amino acid permease [Bifidobacterium actinocoloniiforme]AKV55724.1 amino acid transporter [Bifidobacterium actinocoloniiforme DSM 22766]KFI40737.1 amino acid permease [Bifidobacterium actinocoloniiforme DSM 22766]
MRNSDEDNQQTSASWQAAAESTDGAGQRPGAGNQMERGLSKRHVQFIAIGGTIGTGLFLGSGKSIALTGPSIIFVYIAVGLIMFLLMRAIGELMYADPDQHTFIAFISRYLGPGWGSFAGWSYWIVLILIGMSELTAVGTYFVTFFNTFGIDLSSWRFLIELAFLLAMVAINLIAVRVFGEAEFWFSMIKITLIVGMIATAVVMVIIGFHYPEIHMSGSEPASPAGHAGIDNILNGFSLAPNGWLSFFMSFQMVFFAYEMIEFVGVTVSETQNPRKVLPKAINEIIVRVLIFYVGALVAIMLIVPWRTFKPKSDGTFASPFVMVFRYAGLDWAAALVFFVVITAAASALNSLLYSAGRNLFQLAGSAENPAMRSLAVISKRGHVPARAILVSGLLILLSPVLRSLPGFSSAFVLFASASSAVIIFIYVLLIVTHRRYRASADFVADGFLMPAYRWTGSLAIAFFVFVYASLFLAQDTRASAVCGLIWLLVFGGACLWKHRGAAKA